VKQCRRAGMTGYGCRWQVLKKFALKLDSTINYQLSIINYQLSIINYQLSIINYQLSIINYQLSIIN
ncbi:MAG: hypothetical protein KBF96_03805, partial [Ignavibacteria bacterium]|nr:hypothetical protein [Ignavibacteria bacterium]